MLRRYMRQILEWCHATLVMALVAPMIYAMVVNAYNRDLYADAVDGLYGKGLIVAIPIVLSGLVIKKCKSLVGYAIVSSLYFAGTGMLAWLIGPMLTDSNFLIGYVIVIVAESFAVIGARFAERLNILQMQRDGDLNFVPRTGFFDKPRMELMGAFVVAYLEGILFNNPSLADGAFYSACVYFVICVLHIFMLSTERYFMLNKRVSGVPKKRLYGITSSVVAVFILSSVAVMLVAIVLSDARQYTDIREWKSDRPIQIEEQEAETILQTKDYSVDQFDMLTRDVEMKTLPRWVSDVFMAILGVIFLVFAFQVLKSIRNVFRDFRDAFDENGDEVEDLNELEEKVEALKPKKEDKTSQGYSVRKKYKQMIRKHRKERPMPYETPHEIEQQAGLLADEEMQELHVLYEEVRYGKS